MNLLSSHKMNRSGHKWTDDEVSNIISLYDQGLTIGGIAAIHKRPIGDILVKLKTIGLLTFDSKSKLDDIENMRRLN